MIDPRFYTSHGPVALGDLIQELPVETGSSFDAGAMISSCASLPDSRAGDITYLGGKKFLADLEPARATACLTKPEFEQAVRDAGMMPVISGNPRAHFARLLPKLFTVIRPGSPQILQDPATNIPSCATIMPSVFIAQNVKIGKRVRLGHGVCIGPGVELGDDCDIRAHTSIDCAVIGARVTIGASSVIGQRGFGVVNDEGRNLDIAHLGRVCIGDDVTMGSHCAVDRGTLGDTTVGSGCKFDNFCQVAHNVTIGKNGLFAGFVGISGSVDIGDNVVMGGRVGIADHLSVGDGAQIAAAAGVMKNIPPGEIWSGYPAKPLRQHMKEIATLTKLARPKKST